MLNDMTNDTKEKTMMRRLLRLVDINIGGTWRIKQFIFYLFFTLSCANSYSTFQFRNQASTRPPSSSSSSWHHDNINHHRPTWQANCRDTNSRRELPCFLQSSPRPIKRSKLPHFVACARDFDDDDFTLLSPPSKASSTSSLGEELRQDEADILFSNNNNNTNAAWLESLPKGTPTGFRIVKQYHSLPNVDEDFDWSNLFGEVEEDCKDENNNINNAAQRLELTPRNISLPVALMMADPDEYPSFSRARKACRKGSIIILTATTFNNDNDDDNATQNATTTTARKGEDVDTASLVVFDPDRMRRGRVGDRVFPGDILAKQVRVGDGYSPILSYKKPPFDLPVIIEDDHFALVNKPAGVVVYGHHKGGHGVMTVRAALPFCLQPPRVGTVAIMRRPTSVHRLDRATSGILCIAKTKPAMVHLSRQFHNRIIQKTYMAIINGIPQESGNTAVSVQRARELGVDIQPNRNRPDNDNGSSFNDDASASNTSGWQLIDSPLDGKHAVTVWRAIRYVPSLHAHDGYLTLVEMKPKTGRYHQLRRHMAWVCERPIVGDAEYDNNTQEAQKFRSRGLFLCSSSITLQHPFLNSISTAQETVGEKDFKMMLDDKGHHESHSTNKANSNKDKSLTAGDDSIIWRSPENGMVMVSATIELPEKFESLLAREEERFRKFNQEKVCNYT